MVNTRATPASCTLLDVVVTTVSTSRNRDSVYLPVRRMCYLPLVLLIHVA